MSEEFIKYVLIPESLFSQRAERQDFQNYNPYANKVADLENEMQNILDNPNLDSENKIRKYNALSVSAAEFKKKIDSKLPSSSEHMETENQQQQLREQILDLVPYNMRRKASALFKFLEQSPQIRWDPVTGAINGYEDNNYLQIQDFIKGVVTQNQKIRSDKKRIFVDLIKELSLPEAYITNQTLKNSLNQSGSGIQKRRHISNHMTRNFIIPPFLS